MVCALPTMCAVGPLGLIVIIVTRPGRGSCGTPFLSSSGAPGNPPFGGGPPGPPPTIAPPTCPPSGYCTPGPCSPAVTAPGGGPFRGGGGRGPASSWGAPAAALGSSVVSFTLAPPFTGSSSSTGNIFEIR